MSHAIQRQQDLLRLRAGTIITTSSSNARVSCVSRDASSLASILIDKDRKRTSSDVL
ncbi:hypothetical protein ACHAWF_014862 [Thalassiosira exigua]